MRVGSQLRFLATEDSICFYPTDYDVLSSQVFLDGRWEKTFISYRKASTKIIQNLISPKPCRLNFIWHTGFCCSTLVAKALDHRQKNLSLCEPQIMVEIANAIRAVTSANDAMLRHVPNLIFHLFGRAFAPNALVTLKPAPAANRLLRQAARSTTGPMLFLYSDCRSFVTSIAKLGEEGRKYVRSLFLVISEDGYIQNKLPVDRLISLSDLELAALVWHMQIGECLRNWPLLAQGRAYSLDCDAFLASPYEVLKKIDNIFSLNLGADHLKQVVEGPLFKNNVKIGRSSFSAASRREQHAEVRRQLGSDLDRIVEQSYAVCFNTPRGAPLPNPLSVIDKVYFP